MDEILTTEQPDEIFNQIQYLNKCHAGFANELGLCLTKLEDLTKRVKEIERWIEYEIELNTNDY